MDARYRRYEWGCGELAQGLTAAEIDICYWDWSPSFNAFVTDGHYRSISATWTPWGVYDRVERPFVEGIECLRKGRPFHGRYASEIFRPKVDTEEDIRKGVIDVPNLHPVLKDRLLYALDLVVGKAKGFVISPSLWEEKNHADGRFCHIIPEIGEPGSFDPALMRAAIEKTPFLSEPARENLLYNLTNYAALEAAE